MLHVCPMSLIVILCRAPKLVVLADRGKSLRFLSPNEVRLDVDAMRNWLKDKTYTDHQPWNTSFAPGGSKFVSLSSFTYALKASDVILLRNSEWVMDYLALLLSFVYGQTMKVPRVVLILATGTIGTFLVQFLHRGMSKKEDPRPKKPLPQHKRSQPAPAQPATVPVPPTVTNNAATTSSTTNTPSPSKAKKRRGKN